MADQPHDNEDARQLSFSVAGRLLESFVAIGDQYVDLTERRRAVMTVLTHEIDADCGHWGWGYGNPTDKSIIGVGLIDVGFTDAQRDGIANLSFDADVFQAFYCSIFKELNGSPRTKSLLEEDFVNNGGTKLEQVRKYYGDCGWGTWIQNARYFPVNAYSSVMFFRNHGRPQFNRREADIVELVCSSTSWLHASVAENIPPAKLRKLTERQRTVLMMLLDGLPRKLIARRLGISEATVADHLNAIFACFEVSSTIELASLFLKSQ